MLTLTQLAQYYKEENFKRSPKRILVEYLQYELLDSLYKQKGSEHLSFMGGTAIRIGYNGSRFSEDLNFDNFGLSYPDFQTVLEYVMNDMKLKGFTVEFRFVEKGAYHCYVIFPHMLQKEKLTGHENEKILVRIDAARKEKSKNAGRPVVFEINKFDIYREILLNPADIILSQKLVAIHGRKNSKGRDFFDVSFLYGVTEPNWKYIENMLGTKKEKFQKSIIAKCKALDLEQLAKDVEPFLFRPEDAVRVRSFSRFIEQKLR